MGGGGGQGGGVVERQVHSSFMYPVIIKYVYFDLGSKLATLIFVHFYTFSLFIHYCSYRNERNNE